MWEFKVGMNVVCVKLPSFTVKKDGSVRRSVAEISVGEVYTLSTVGWFRGVMSVKLVGFKGKAYFAGCFRPIQTYDISALRQITSDVLDRTMVR